MAAPTGPAADADTQYRIGLDHQDLRRRCSCSACATRGGSTSPTRSGPPPRDRGGRRTMLQLLSHTAGIAAETAGPWWERTARRPAGTCARVLRVRTRSSTRRAPVPLLEPGLRRSSARWSRGCGGDRSPRCSRRRSWIRSACAGRPRCRSRRTHSAGPCTRGPTCCCPNPTPDAGWMAPAGQLWSTVEDLSRLRRVPAGRRRPGAVGGHAARDARAGVARRARGTRLRHRACRPAAGRTSWSGTAGRCPASSPACGCASTTRVRATEASSCPRETRSDDPPGPPAGRC